LNYGGAIKTERDKIAINLSKDKLKEVVNHFKDLPIENLRTKYGLHKDSRDWSVARAKKDVGQNFNFDLYLKSIEYRPFDRRFIYYTGNSKGFVGTPGYRINRHLMKNNFALNSTKYNRQLSLGYFFISTNLTDIHLLDSAADSLGTFPLYIYPESIELFNTKQRYEREPNLNKEIVQKISQKINTVFTPEKAENSDSFAPIDLLDYIYAALYSPEYRETYKEFLKIDFPRVPYPKNQDIFWQLAEFGGELRQLHLLESPTVDRFITTYPQNGDNVITRKITKKDYEQPEGGQTGKVWINDQQYFDNVPQVAWNFYIGGYQPAQKWLKVRQGRTLEFDDILHYQKIIVALTETNRIMQEIDKIDFME